MPNSGMNEVGPSNDEYQTPPWLFKALDTEFGFTMDGAASKENALVNHFSSRDNQLPWDTERVFCNPPYSIIDQFVELAMAPHHHIQIAVLLLPNRTDTAWFQRLNESPRVTLRFLRKRVRFYLGGKETDSPRFGSIIAIVRPQ